MKTPLALIVATAILASAAPSEPARACSYTCAAYIFPAKGTVPANLPGLSFGVTGNGYTDAPVALTETLPDGTSSEVPLEIDTHGTFAKLLRPLVVGASYHANFVEPAPSQCYVEHFPGVTFVAGPEAAWPPVTLGVIEVDPQALGERSVYDASPACTASGAAVARKARLVLDPVAEPWAEVMFVSWQTETLERFMTSEANQPSPSTAASDIEVYRSCADDALPDGLAAGQHTLTVTARLAGRDETTAASQDFDIACPGDDAGCGGAPAGSALFTLLVALMRRARATAREAPRL